MLNTLQNNRNNYKVRIKRNSDEYYALSEGCNYQVLIGDVIINFYYNCDPTIKTGQQYSITTNNTWYKILNHKGKLKVFSSPRNGYPCYVQMDYSVQEAELMFSQIKDIYQQAIMDRRAYKKAQIFICSCLVSTLFFLGLHEALVNILPQKETTAVKEDSVKTKSSDTVVNLKQALQTIDTMRNRTVQAIR